MRKLNTYRRSSLGIAACTTGLAGCIGGLDRNAHHNQGNLFIPFGDIDHFSGVVRIVPSCRDEAVEIPITDGQSNEPIPYIREELGEGCLFEIFVESEDVKPKSIHMGGAEQG